MVRWAPDAQTRLADAAFELYAGAGFDDTTVAQIAARAGLTERTFYRHFADKREVLFFGAAALQEYLIAQVDAAPAGAPPLDVVVDALEAAGSTFFQGRRTFVRRRQAIIAAHPDLQERELIKLAALAAALAAALRRRGVGDPAASLAAEAGIAVFRIAFETWVGRSREASLAAHIRTSAEELRTVAGSHGQQRGRR